jgi:hypothetical protein
MIPNGPAEWLCRHLNLNWQDIRDLAAHYGLRGLKGLRKNDDGQDAPAVAFTWPGLDARKVRVFPKTFCWEGTSRPVLWPALNVVREAFQDADGLVMTEGEFDALILLYLGIPAVSVTGGADTPIPTGLGRELNGLGFRKVLILADADRPGIEAGRRWERALREDGLAVKTTTVVELGLGRASYGEKDIRDAWLSRTDLDEAAFVKPILQAMEGMDSTERATDEGVNVLEVGLLRAEDLNGHESAGPTWLVEPVLPDGAVVLLAGKYDSCKTWTALYMAKQVLETTGRQVVYLDFDMMPLAVVRERLRATGLDRYVRDRLRFHSGPDMTALTATERWGEVVDALLSMPPGLLVLDSLKAWLLNVKLNSDSDVLPYLQSLLRLRAAGWTVLVIHHVPKTGDGDFKNTGSIGDAVDVIWRGRREGAILKLEARKRRIEVPASVGLDMTDPAHPIPLDGDVAERRAREARILAFVKENPGCTRPQIADGVGVPDSGALKRLLADLVQQGRLAVEGKGTRPDPFRYYLPDDAPPQESRSDAEARIDGAEKSAPYLEKSPAGDSDPADHIGKGPGPNPGPVENHVVSPTSWGEQFGPPHQTYNSEGSPGDGPDGQDPDPADPREGPKIGSDGPNCQSLQDGAEGQGDTSGYPQAPEPPENGPLRERGGPPGHLDPETARLCADCWERGIVKMGYIIGTDGRRRCGECLLLLSTSEAKLRNPNVKRRLL